MFWGTNIESGPGKPNHPTFCDKFPHKTTTGRFVCDCGWHDSDKAVDNIIVNYFLMMQNGVLWSHVEGAPNEYMCRACVNDKPGSFNTYNLDDFDAHFSKKQVVEPKSLDDSIKKIRVVELATRDRQNCQNNYMEGFLKRLEKKGVKNIIFLQDLVVSIFQNLPFFSPPLVPTVVIGEYVSFYYRRLLSCFVRPFWRQRWALLAFLAFVLCSHVQSRNDLHHQPISESTAAVVSSSTFTKPFQTISTAVSTDVTSSTYSTTTTEAQAGPGISLIAATTIATTTTSADIESERISSITTASTTTADTMATTSEPTTTSTAPEEPITCADFPNPFNATNGDSFQIVCDTLPRIIFSIGTPIRGISFKACLDVFTQTSGCGGAAYIEADQTCKIFSTAPGASRIPGNILALLIRGQ
ncbi:hypothetical protein QL093DRAFT_2582965 [Fusarium oxysporum]|nr:hypothetical protein QL093DRAFT_2582965 [Fusarium oxysporum]